MCGNGLLLRQLSQIAQPTVRHIRTQIPLIQTQSSDNGFASSAVPCSTSNALTAANLNLEQSAGPDCDR
jgi:hypothetical protein